MSVKTAILPYITIILICCFVACNTEKPGTITKEWKAVDIENRSLEKQKAYYDILMDTITEKNERLEFFNGSIDSFKRFTILAFEEQEAIQKTEIENSFMEFNKNGIAYFKSINGVDSAKWTQEENEIVLDAEDFTGIPNIVRFGIVELTSDKLILKKVDYPDTTIITLKVKEN
jgi:hypothetical protein